MNEQLPSLESLGIYPMSEKEQIELVGAMRDGIVDSDARPPISNALRDELDRRLADHAANPADVVPWEEAKASALARMNH